MKNFIVLLMIFALLAVSADVTAAQRNESDFDYRIPFSFARIANCQKAVSLRHAPDVYSDCIVEIPLGTKIFVKDKLPINDFNSTQITQMPISVAEMLITLRGIWLKEICTRLLN